MQDPDGIEWDGPAETWTWPFTDEQLARLNNKPAFDGHMMSVVGIGPYAPDLIVEVGYGDLPAYLDGTEHGDEWQVRFGRMSPDALYSLPEHGGW
jgi:hypothetical protein